MASLLSKAAGRRLLLAIAPLLLVLAVPGAVDHLRQPRIPFKLNQNQVLLVDEGHAAHRAGVREGDLVLRVEGRPLRGSADLQAASASLAAGDTLRARIARSGAAFDVAFALEPRDLHTRVLDLLMGVSVVCFLFLGFLTYLRRDDALGRSFYLTCVLFAIALVDMPRLPSAELLRFLQALRDAAAPLLPAVFLRFVWIFPEGTEEGAESYRRQRRWLVPPLLLAPLHVWSNYVWPSAGSRRIVDALLIATALLFAVYMVVALVVFARKIRRRDRWVRWSQLRLALFGMIAGIVPLALVAVLRQFLPTDTLLLDELATLMLPVVPASFSFALLRSGAIDLARLLRQASVVAVAALPILALTALVTGSAGLSLQPAARTALFVGILLFIPMGALVLRSPARLVMGVVDRVVYPEQRAIRAASKELGGRLTECRDPELLARVLSEGLRDVVGARSAAVYRVDDDDLVCVGSSQRSFDPVVIPDRIPREARLLQRALATHDLLLVEALVLGHEPTQLDEVSRAWLDQTSAVLLCPLSSNDRALALVVIGGRSDGGAYGATHHFHVQSLCRLGAVAWENAMLHAEDLARERDRTEIELAREIQRNLLPNDDLRLEGVEVSGRMISCHRVGGDLYDHFLLSNGNVVVTVADAAGKGVPASLLVSSMRTALRETIRPGLALDEALVHINRHVHGMTGTGHFIAVFVGVLDPKSRVLEYCVAGIEPPLWYRSGRGRVELLARGGPVLGIDPTARYRSGTVRMESGDLLLAYSDGLVDEENAEGVEFGRERLLRTLLLLGPHSAAEALEGVLEAVRRHGATSETVDDTTAIVLKIPRAAAAGTDLATHPGV